MEPFQPTPPPKCAACETTAQVQWQRRSATDADSIEAVYACGTHAISLGLAAQVHAATCTAPDPAALPGCGCTPEPVPTPQPDPQTTTTVTLPTGWTVPA